MTIDDFRIYDTVLTDVGSPSDIDKLADDDPDTNPSATPIIWYDFDETTGSTADNSGSLDSVYHFVGYQVLNPEESTANIYDKEAQLLKTVNFKDYAELAKYWLYTTPDWP